MAIRSQPTVTRPANTTAYDIGDVVGGAFQFTGISMGSGGGNRDLVVLSAALRVHVASIPAGMAGFTFYLYDATPPSAIADNAAFGLAAGDRANFLGSVSVGSPSDLGATLYFQSDIVNRPIRLSGAGLWGYMVTAAAYTPAGNSEEYVPELWLSLLPT